MTSLLHYSPVTYALEVHDLKKRYHKANFNAVDGIDLQIKDGEIYGFLGPNGAGKSTAIKMFVTTLFPTSGDISLFGIDPQKNPHKVREMIGVVYQNPSLDENLTAEENLRSHAVLYNMTGFSLTYNQTSALYKERLEQVLQLVELEDRKFDIVKTFSGGMKRRLDLAKALLHEPKILFLDEPTTGLDPHSRREVWQHINDLQNKKKFTVFLTTHYLDEAEICDRISIMDKGKILVTDTPNNLKKMSGNELLYLTPDKPTLLEQELHTLKVRFTKDKEDNFIVTLKNRRAQEILRQIKTDLREINIKRPALDDVFIQLTGRKIQ